MKITDPNIIKNGEKDLIESVKDDLDQDVIRQILKEKFDQAVLSAKGGEIVVHNNEIAFRVDFDLSLSGSLMFDRQGNYLDESDTNLETEKLLELDEPIELDDPIEEADPDALLSENLDLDADHIEDAPGEKDENIDPLHKERKEF